MKRSLLAIIAIGASFLMMTGCGDDFKTVKIGGQVWMAENMNVQTEHSWCYDNNPENCEKYGRLYTWDDATTVCKDGWRLPSNDDWMTLFTIVGGKENAGKMLKNMIGWSKGGVGINSFGFSVLPAGVRRRKARFEYIGEATAFWSSTNDEDRGDRSYAWEVTYKTDYVDDNSVRNEWGLSVRCVKDAE